MIEFSRFNLVLLVFLLELLTRFNSHALMFGPKMLSITCKPFWMNFCQRMFPILLLMDESDHHKYLDHCRTKVIHYYLLLMVKDHPYILDGGILYGFCNGIMLKGCFIHLLSLTGCLLNYRYLLSTSFVFDEYNVLMKLKVYCIYLPLISTFVLISHISVPFRKKICLRFGSCYCLLYMVF